MITPTKSYLQADTLNTIGKALGFNVDGSYNLVQWQDLLEHASYQGYNVSRVLENIKRDLPDGVTFELQTIEDKLQALSIYEGLTNAPNNLRAKFYGQIVAVNDALNGAQIDE